MPWWSRDPDLGRDRETKALGRRDWNWFTPYTNATGAGATPADSEPAQPPWAGHPVTAHDRHDRTLGIPPRHISMWPTQPSTFDSHPGWTPRRSAAQITDDLRWLRQPPPPPDVEPALLAAALADVTAHGHARPAVVQELVLIQTANRHGLDPAVLTDLARGVGEMVAKTTHRAAGNLPGEPALNALAGAYLPLAAEIYLARAHLTWATICSDPDLPRLWMLANALAHSVPAHTILATPARTHGPAAVLQPTRDDLIGWYGIAPAAEHLYRTLDAIRRGRHWLATAVDNPTNRLLALGVLDLTHPTEAARLVARGPSALQLDQVRALLAGQPTPAGIADLTDPALKAVCDRNGWLHGTPDERTHRELVERQITAALPAYRARIAAGDPAALADGLHTAPADTELDRSSWRNQPPAPDAVHNRHLLDIASREAAQRFTGLDIAPRLTRAAALAARFPDRIGARTLRITEAGLALRPEQPPPPRLPPQPELDFGL
jgi:hypothetical protein